MDQQRYRIARQHGPNMIGDDLAGPKGQPQSVVALHLGEEQEEILRADFRGRGPVRIEIRICNGLGPGPGYQPRRSMGQ